ncbi:MAG TPA: peptidoglycan-binding domain-containing protein [Acidimicrobiales bacterium]|nr:peptidoglycan-binding domain-containing protein [Acidimicrobiales bacterium]
MADTTVKRVVLIAAVAGALVGGAVAGGVAAASANGGGGANPSAGGTGSVTTAAVVRTNLQSTVQVGGSIGYQGSYAVAAPTGATAQQVAQAQQAVTQAQQTLAADQTAEADSAAADAQTASAALTALDTAASTLAADRAAAAACAGRGASGPGCAQDGQKVSQDQTQYTQAQQQYDSAESNAGRDHDQAQAKVQSDTTQMQAAESNLAATEATAVNPGTTYTALPKVGDIIGEDQAVYSVDGVPVPLLYGDVAAYRAFQPGMTDGPDVGELTHDLIALGYGAGLAPSDHYSAATEAAVQRWQAALGVPATGSVLLGEVVFEPGPIRVTSVTPSVGQGVTAGNILDATSTAPIVTVDLDVTQEYLVKPGDTVTVELPDGVTTVTGRVQSVGNVAVCPNGNGQGSGNGSPNASNSADQTPCSSSGSGSSSTPTVTVTITLDGSPAGATLDQAPVNVNITTQRADGVLAVPVNALLALEGGGDAVEVVSGSTQRLVGVTTGLYSNTLVQISGAGITAGTLVEVPAS